MRRVLISLCFVCLFWVTITTTALGDRSINHYIITFDDDPIHIKNARIREVEERYGSKIKCEVRLANRYRDVKAYALGFMFYDVFNEHLSTIGGVSMSELNRGKEETAIWKFDPYKGWMAYTVIIYLSKVRFADDTIWRQDKHRLSKRITEATDLLFKEEQLEEKER